MDTYGQDKQARYSKDLAKLTADMGDTKLSYLEMPANGSAGWGHRTRRTTRAVSQSCWRRSKPSTQERKLNGNYYMFLSNNTGTLQGTEYLLYFGAGRQRGKNAKKNSITLLQNGGKLFI